MSMMCLRYSMTAFFRNMTRPLTFVIFRLRTWYRNSLLNVIMYHITLRERRCFGEAVEDSCLKISYDKRRGDAMGKLEIRWKSTLYRALGALGYNNSDEKLDDGCEYRVRIFQVLRRVTTEDCVIFLRRRHALFTGLEGLELMYNNSHRYDWPCSPMGHNFRLFSFGSKFGDGRMIPFVTDLFLRFRYEIDVDFWKHGLPGGSYLLCFSKPES